MSDGIQTVVRDGRRAYLQSTGNAMNTAALQGANIAFLAHSAQRGSQLNNQNTGETMRATPKIDSSRPSKLHNEPEPESEMPEVGLVMDRIKAFSGPGHNHARPSVQSKRSGGALKPEPPQIQAAALAASRSASRTRQTATSSRSISPIKRAATGSSLSRRDAISPAPKPDFLSARSPRLLHAPAPVRKTPGVAHSLANITNEDKTGSGSERSQSRQPGLRENEMISNRLKTGNIIDSSPNKEPSISPLRQPLNRDEPRQAPPILKPKPVTSIIEERKLRSEPSKRSIPRLPEDTYTNVPQSPRNNTPRNRDNTPSDTATILSSHTHSTSDEATITGSLQSINRQDTGNADAASGMTKEALADAIIASSLASSRAPSPYSPPPPLPPPRRTRSRSLLHPGDILKKDARTTPSPPKGLRQTLRDPPKSDDEASKNSGRRHLIKHHPHKHHEGDRRRWRQEVAETSRKRYEGVWAANKGLCVPPEGFIYRMFPDLPRTLVISDLVVNLVVRDIWIRSRLPDHTLEQIWNLVDRKEIGMLGREEFVVGLWLIDETLRGHKIPVKVPDSVWDSVRHSPGIKLPHDF